MKRVLRIGTRESALALWQANTVKDKLHKIGVNSELITIKSTGDIVKDQPLYAMGITGIFTKALDIALLEDQIDLAVHSMKDVPTRLPQNLITAAVLKRGNPFDVLVHKGLDFLNADGIVATGSLRRKAQWLHRYPLHELTGLRGNVETRLTKLEEGNWNAAIFAAAGLERLGITPANTTVLQWMVPAPAQGAVCVLAREKDRDILEILSDLNDEKTALCTGIERDFLQVLEGGCSAPIGALAHVEENELHFKGVLHSLDGSQRIISKEIIALEKADELGARSAREVLKKGGDKIIEDIRNTLSP